MKSYAFIPLTVVSFVTTGIAVALCILGFCGIAPAVFGALILAASVIGLIMSIPKEKRKGAKKHSPKKAKVSKKKEKAVQEQ